MDMLEPLLSHIKIHFTERKINAKVMESHPNGKILILIGKDFLDMFEVKDRIIVADEFLSPGWGNYLYDNLDGFPYWVAQVKYETVHCKKRPSELKN
jgi:hypothetical protein